MPLTKKGKSILRDMVGTYHSERKAKSVMYAMINLGRLHGVERGKH
jgi:hypothetical protein